MRSCSALATPHLVHQEFSLPLYKGARGHGRAAFLLLPDGISASLQRCRTPSSGRVVLPKAVNARRAPPPCFAPSAFSSHHQHAARSRRQPPPPPVLQAHRRDSSSPPSNTRREVGGNVVGNNSPPLRTGAPEQEGGWSLKMQRK